MRKIFLLLSIVGFWNCSKAMAPLRECVTDPSLHADNVVKAVQAARDAASASQDLESKDKLKMWAAALKQMSSADKQWCKECKNLWLQGFREDSEQIPSESHQVLFNERCMYPFRHALYRAKPGRKNSLKIEAMLQVIQRYWFVDHTKKFADVLEESIVHDQVG
jgi:hypothetical protein